MTESFERTHQLIILSGKGGTGKTSLCAAFAHLCSSIDPVCSSVYVDADVDAANLSLVLKPETVSPQEFWGGSLAEIDAQLCTACEACVSVCRYDAILPDLKGQLSYWVDPVACDGCAACVYACPQKAIRMVTQQDGNWFQSKTPFGTIFHAELFPGKENSGKLVTLIKQQARLFAEDSYTPLIIIDGPPGIGCPVISACAGVDLGLIITEPSVAGLHDLKRALGTLQHFHIPAVICVNKADIFPEGTRQIYEYANSQNIEVIGEIPYDENVTQAMIQGSPITELFPDSIASQSIRDIWNITLSRLFHEENPSNESR